jgi:hypothetical protein
MKLSLLALILCIGLFLWNTWLQIQVGRLSNSASSSFQVTAPSELKLTKLEIINGQGDVVIAASADDKGLGLLAVKGLVTSTEALVESEKDKVAMLTGTAWSSTRVEQTIRLFLLR